jgi:hypothetical protein
MTNKCARCGRDHTNDKPFNIKEAEDNAANALAKEIDQMVLASLHMSDKGYKLSTHEKHAEFERKRNGQN